MFNFISVVSLPWCGSIPEECPCYGLGCPMGCGPSQVIPICSTPPKGASLGSHCIPFLCFFLCPSVPSCCVSFPCQELEQVRWGVGCPGCSVGVGSSPWISAPLCAARGLLPQRIPCSLPLPKYSTLHPIQLLILLLCNVKKYDNFIV